MSLFETLSQIALLESQLEESHGEISPEMEEKLFQLDMAKAEDIDRISFILERLESTSLFWKERAEKALCVSSALMKANQRLKDHVKTLMLQSQTTELLGDESKFKLSIGKNKMVVDDETKARTLYGKPIISVAIDKEAIKQDLEKGIDKGVAHLEPIVTLRPSTNSAASRKKEIK